MAYEFTHEQKSIAVKSTHIFQRFVKELKQLIEAVNKWTFYVNAK